MRALIAVVWALAFSLAAQAQDASPLSEYLWLKRPLVVFADTPNDPRYIRQMELLEKNPADREELEERDVVILTDSDPAANTPLRQALHPRGFMLVIYDKDGRILFRKPLPWSVREISRAIDKTPMRQDEISEKLGK